jgi:hypothetical protein
VRIPSLAAAASLLAAPALARADEYEASIELQATGGFARVAEDRANEADLVPAAGVTARATYGLRNWLALEADLSVNAFGEAQYRDMQLRVGGGIPRPGDLARTSRAARLVAGPLFRAGVVWIPTAFLGAGVQGRWQGIAAFGDTRSMPDGYGNELAVDLVATARIGLDRRLGRRWIIGASAGVTHAFPLGGPALDVVEGGLSIAAFWYPP